MKENCFTVKFLSNKPVSGRGDDLMSINEPDERDESLFKPKQTRDSPVPLSPETPENALISSAYTLTLTLKHCKYYCPL